MVPRNSIKLNPTRKVLDRLHAAARRDRIRYLSLFPRLVFGFVRRKSFFEVITPESMKDCYIPISREQGQFLYITLRALQVKNAIEFGTSFGISTIYLAAAIRDSGEGVVIGTEIEPSKWSQARMNLREAGLEAYSEIRVGDALETLKEVPEPVDFVLLDGWKGLYIPVLEVLKPRLRKGAVIIADNIFTFRRGLRPYVEHVQSGENGFASTTLAIGEGFEYSIYLG